MGGRGRVDRSSSNAQEKRRWQPPKITEADRERVWTKHKPNATVPKKTRVPEDWTENRYFGAVERVRRSDDATYLRSGDKDTFTDEVDHVILRVVERGFSDGHSEFWTSYPVSGRGVTYVDQYGLVWNRP